jgi:hypothetical protein
VTVLDTAQALEDFQSDPQYLEAALKSVRLTKRKRRSLVIRTAAHRVVEQSQQRCVESGTQVCLVAGPCGTGACPFAEGILSGIRMQPTSGEAQRPPGVVSEHPSWDQEQLVKLLRQLLPHT